MRGIGRWVEMIEIGVPNHTTQGIEERRGEERRGEERRVEGSETSINHDPRC